MLVSSKSQSANEVLQIKRQLAAILTIFVFLFCIIQTARKAHADAGATTQTNARTLQIAGLRDKVTVTRDERGIPYIEANNDEDLYFAQGFVAASDRLWQMDLF